ncbi:MAG TPA: outer membrane protein assembly factor BamB [Gammaproteobacteria bacterium]|nr:outer membrane protein assembly factor BamB [Gammaproteobacteria bacterium]
MKKLSLLCACGLALLLAGCLSNNVEPPAPLVKFTSTVDVQRVWSHSIGGADAILHLGIVPASDDNNIYAASSNGNVYAFRLKDGERLWKADTDFGFSAGPGVGDGIVVVAAHDGTVLALDAASGKQLWQAGVDAEILASPAVSNTAVVVHSTDGHVIALSPVSGQKLWNISREPPKLSLRGSAAPLIIGNTVYVGLNTGKLLALNLADGSQRWELTLSLPNGSDELSRLTDLDGVIAHDSSNLFAVTFQGKVAAVSPDSGQMQWSREMSSYTGVSTDAEHAYVSDVHGGVWALDKANGVPSWTQPALRARDVTLPVPYMGAVVVGDLDGYLHFMSASDGSFVARVSLDGDAIQAPPIVAGGLLVALSTGGELAAYRIVKPDSSAAP